MSDELAALVDRARNDELPVDEQHAAFAELVRRFEEPAFGWSLQFLGDPEEAKDVAQDAFIAAWLKLRQLRDARAFGAWLKRLIATQCSRRRRKERASESLPDTAASCDVERREQQRQLAVAIGKLSESERRVIVLFYFLGKTIDEIAAMLGAAKGTVGKRLHLARISIRRKLPRAVRADFLPRQPHFLRQLREGLFDEYLGEYRFEERPELIVRIVREGAQLVSYGGGQRSVLASIRDSALATTEFDGEGRFHRDRNGRIVQFVYYEFGARLGVAKKTYCAPCIRIDAM